MTNKLRAVLAAIAPLVCGTLYIKACHDPQVRAEALQGQQDTRDNLTIARMAAESFQRESVFQRQRDSTGRVIARLKARVIPRDSIILHDTVEVVAQFDARDSVIAAQDGRHEQDSLYALFLTAEVVAYRDSLVPTLKRARDNWKQSAQRPNYAVTDIAGGVIAGLGAAKGDEKLIAAGAAAVVAPRILHGVTHLLAKLF